jgi:hypothetical protein
MAEDRPPLVEGEDDAPPLDPYTPEPGPRVGERRAFRVLSLAFIVIGIVVAIVVWAAVR